MEKNEKQQKKGIFDFRVLIKNPKMVKILIYGGFAIILLFFLSNILSGTDSGSGEVNTDDSVMDLAVDEHERQLEQKLERAISAVDGVGELTIIVTLDSLSETVYSERGTDVRTVITPKVRGVAIICDGGGDIVVKQKIVELVSRVLGINSTKISVTD